ncbi:MAG TPA: transposase, partial [Candidatus Saccharimonadia bacterium]|nr:transposase [Candidatus Saccharimonadia bacterium]
EPSPADQGNDDQRGHRQRTMTLDAVACLRRFLLHVLPRGFKRMRDDGFCAHGVCPVKLPLCRRVLGKSLCAPVTAASSTGRSIHGTMAKIRAARNTSRHSP